MPSRDPRPLRRRFSLGSGPLKRRSDRLEFASRLLLLLALLCAVPAGLTAGAAAYAGTEVTAGHQAATRYPGTATLVFDAPEPEPGDDEAATTAIWTAPAGGTRTGRVEAPAGTRAGEVVDIWVDASGELSSAPLGRAEVAGQAVVVGALVAVCLAIAGLTGHLLVTWRLERRRSRNWAVGWASVEPLWVTRFG